METINFGPNQEMKLTEPLDTWLSSGLRDFAVPEAVGSSARVFRLNYAPLSGGFGDQPAIKVMRPDKTSYARPLFESEVRILEKIQGIPGITPLIGLGFLQIREGSLPDEIAPLSISLAENASAENVAGVADWFSLEEIDAFLTELDDRIADNWLAFLVFPRRWEDNLYLRCDAGYTRGEFHRSFSVKEALLSGIQICDILASAHEKGIVYLDHKALHYYWNQPRQQVMAIDWNIGRLITNGNTAEAFAFDVLQFSARALHHFMTGRQAFGSVKVGPNMPEEIENAPEKYDPIWTYDDQKRLTQDELDVLASAIQGQYSTPQTLALDLQTLYNQRQSQS